MPESLTAVGIIPARYASNRFPGKALAPIDGVALLERVFRAARTCRRLREVLVATDDERICAFCQSIGAPVVRTASAHPTGSDRLAEVARDLRDDVIVNIQGDEPLIEARVIEAALDALEKPPGAPMATVVHEADESDLDDPNSVKVVLDRRAYALYFSRARIPACKENVPRPIYWRHVGIYAYRRDFLLEFAKLARGEAERAEGLEQLRALENGYAIRAATIEGWRGVAVDVPEDVARVEARLRAASP